MYLGNEDASINKDIIKKYEISAICMCGNLIVIITSTLPYFLALKKPLYDTLTMLLTYPFRLFV